MSLADIVKRIKRGAVGTAPPTHRAAPKEDVFVGNVEVSVESQVDHLLSGSKPQCVIVHHSKNRSSGLSGFFRKVCIVALVGMLVAVCVFVPIFGGKSGLDVVQEFLDFNGSEDIISIGDPPSGSPYDMWYAPPNSFGISETKSVNWTYFKQLFLAHTDWMLEARIGTGEWFNADEYLTIERTWNESGFWKFNLILDKPAGSPMVDARFTFGIDLSCLQYVEKSGTEVWINYTANETEIYSVMFNWSDIASIPGLVITKGVQGDMFWFRFRRDDIPAGLQHYEFDPTFGHTDVEASTTSVEGHTHGVWAIPSSDGTVDNISVYLRWQSAFGDNPILTASLYEYVDFSSDYAGALFSVGNRTLSGGHQVWNGPEWITIELDTNYAITSGIKYYIVITDTTIDQHSANIYYKNTDPAEIAIYANDRTPDDPLVNDVSSTINLSIYCTYTESGVENTAPTIAGEIPANTSTGIGLTPVCNVTANDEDGDSLNVTFYENTSGSYVMRQKNTSISANSSVQWDNYSNANTGSTKYWWKVHVDDGTDNVSEIYHFTTAANKTWQQNFTGWWTGGNISTWIQNFTGYWTGGNDTVSWTQNFTGWWTGGNIGSWTQNFTGWWTGGNISRVWDQNFTGYFTGGNVSIFLSLTNEYPVNGSNIFSVQPTLYFTLSSPLGGMSYSIYIGNTNTTANFLLDSDSGLDNGTFHYVNFYNASGFSTTYWWRVHYNDSSSHVNSTFGFTPVQPGGGGMISNNGLAGGLAGGLAAGMFVFVLRRRRRERKA